MILKGSQRGGATQLARHLMNELDNDHIALHNMRGFVASDLSGALKEVQAISKATKCSQYLFSLSLNPPQAANPDPTVFEAAIDAVEQKLGLTDQPRAIVFHEKNGRRHAHAVWSRVDVGRLRSINLPHFKMKLNDISRELFLTHEWGLPAGFKDKHSRDPLNYGSVESEQARRAKRNPKAIKEVFRRCWEQSDDAQSFAHALAEKGYILAKGDRRGFVAVDKNGEIYSIARWVGIKAKDVRARLGSPDHLPSVSHALAQFDLYQSDTIDEQITQHADRSRDALLAFTAKRLELVKEQQAARQQLERDHLEQRRSLALSHHQTTSGDSALATLWNRLSGQETTEKEQRRADWSALETRQAAETQNLIASQLKQRRALQHEYQQLRLHHELGVRQLWCELGSEVLKQQEQSEDLLKSLCVQDPSQPLIIESEQDSSLGARVRKHPPIILEHISQHKEYFTRHDIVRDLANHIDNPTALHLAIEETLVYDQLVEVEEQSRGRNKRYTTQELIDTKKQLMGAATSMAQSFHADVSLSNITAALKLQNVKLHREVSAHLSAQQEQAIRHVLEPQQLRIVTGYAGAGKSTMLEAAAQAWKHSGLNVIGGALSGKAADGLEKSSGIPSRTLASLQKSWEGGYNLLTNKDVLVIDEAGMVDVRQMAKIVNAVNKYGAKLVMVGDAEQLQPIMAGTPFKEMEEQIGSTSLSEIRRQKHDWQREASILLAEQKAQDALNMYQERGCVHMATTTESAISALVSDYMKDVEGKRQQKSVVDSRAVHR